MFIRLCSVKAIFGIRRLFVYEVTILVMFEESIIV